MTKTILHIDFDSFFASVEQQANPFLRGKPIAITGSNLKRGIACTASREAKKLGVKTGMPMFKVRELCPHIIPIKGDGSKYIYIQRESLKIFAKYTDLVEPFSIDEAFLDVTNTLKFFKSAQNITYLIKRDILQAFGPYVTCSIGIGPNKLLAKLVSSINKPNGVYEVTPENVQHTLRSVELQDFCGIGPRLTTHLAKLGITTVMQLQNAPLTLLYGSFGSVTGSFLKNTSFGQNYGEVKTIDYTRPVKSISHQHTLHKNTQDPAIIKANFLRLSEMVAKRLRKQEMVGKTIYMGIRTADRTKSFGSRTTLKTHTDSTRVIYHTAVSLFDSLAYKQELRLISVGISNLVQKHNSMLPLFPADQTLLNLDQTLDRINDKWGSYTIISAKTLLADTTKGKISSFLKHS